MIYRRRHNALSRGSASGVSRTGAGVRRRFGHVRRWAWKDFVSVRLCHEPTRFKPWRYTFHAQFKSGEKWSSIMAIMSAPAALKNGARLTRRSCALLARLHKPTRTSANRETQKRYFFMVLGALVGLCGLAYVLVVARTPLDGLPFSGALKLPDLAMLPLFWGLMARRDAARGGARLHPRAGVAACLRSGKIRTVVKEAFTPAGRR